jgi:enoyl-CoA hydratase/carnithine racemase
MNKVRFETSGALGFLTLANPPLNLFDEELIEDLRTAVNQAKQAPIRALLVRASGKVFSAGADVSILREGRRLRRVIVSRGICERSRISKSSRFPLSRLYRGSVSQPGSS